MAKLMCKMCGGEIVSSPYAKLATCAACRTVQTVPAGEDAQKAARFNRANKLRMYVESDFSSLLRSAWA